MDSVEEEYQARRAEDRARHHIDNPNYHHHYHPLLQNIPLAPVWNKGREGRCHLSLIILYFKISLLLLFGIEEEEEDVISLLYMFLQT